MLYQDIRDAYFMPKRAELIGAEFATIECLADPITFPKKLLEKDWLAGSAERIFLHARRPYVLGSGFHLCNSRLG